MPKPGNRLYRPVRIETRGRADRARRTPFQRPYPAQSACSCSLTRATTQPPCARSARRRASRSRRSTISTAARRASTARSSRARSSASARDMVGALQAGVRSAGGWCAMAVAYVEATLRQPDLARFIIALIHNPPRSAPAADFVGSYEGILAELARTIDAAVARGEIAPGPTDVRLLIVMGALGRGDARPPAGRPPAAHAPARRDPRRHHSARAGPLRDRAPDQPGHPTP